MKSRNNGPFSKEGKKKSSTKTKSKDFGKSDLKYTNKRRKKKWKRIINNRILKG